uniref:Uncharacterized protein n=1 Tax=Anguilla anguilla TaxID=7936 RepID=A0A0E9SZ45_ANGAN
MKCSMFRFIYFSKFLKPNFGTTKEDFKLWVLRCG